MPIDPPARPNRPAAGVRGLIAKLVGGRGGTTPVDDADSRIYAIGDIHGRLDLLRPLIERIRIDSAARAPRQTWLVILGDYVDRGPESAQVVRLLMRLRHQPHVVVLKGNHEAIMVDALAGDYAALDLWLEHGGAATLASFGAAPIDPDEPHGPALMRRLRVAIPPDVRAWLSERPTAIDIGRYHFVHAGVRPGVALAEQRDEDRLWIGADFTGSEADHGAIIVHGHTISEHGVAFAGNRIGVDTGAYRTGRLSAVGLENDEQWEITVAEPASVPIDAAAPQ